MKLTVAQYKRLLQDKFEAETKNEEVYVGILLDLVERVVALEKVNAENRALTAVVAKEVGKLKSGSAPVMPGSDDEEDLTPNNKPDAGGGAAKDATPFPAGVQAGGPIGAKPPVTIIEEDLTPDVPGGGAINPQPIPKKNGNGAGASV